MMNQEVIFGLAAQTFFYDPPEGQPTGTPVCQVFLATSDDDGAAETATSGSCTVDSVSKTLAVAAVAGDLSITLNTVTGMVQRRRYLLESATGDREWIEVLTINTSTAVVGLRQPLRNAYAVTTSTVKGCRISINVDSTWVNTKSKITDILGSTWRTDQEAKGWVPGTAGYRLRWSYVVGGVNQLGVSYADLVRYQAKNLVNPLDVDRRFPGWIDRLPLDYREDQGQGLIDEAFLALRMDALGDEQLVRRVRNTEVLRELVVYRANMVAQEAALFNAGANADAVQKAQDLYTRRYNQLIREPKVPVDQSGGGSAAEPRRTPVWRR